MLNFMWFVLEMLERHIKMRITSSLLQTQHNSAPSPTNQTQLNKMRMQLTRPVFRSTTKWFRSVSKTVLCVIVLLLILLMLVLKLV